jgi:transcriptional regulator with XRE-family HTH domain
MKTKPMSKEEKPGKMLKGLRLRAELSQKDLADKLNVDVSDIISYENNEVKIPKSKAKVLANILETVEDDFLY